MIGPKLAAGWPTGKRFSWDYRRLAGEVYKEVGNYTIDIPMKVVTDQFLLLGFYQAYVF